MKTFVTESRTRSGNNRYHNGMKTLNRTVIFVVAFAGALLAMSCKADSRASSDTSAPTAGSEGQSAAKTPVSQDATSVESRLAKLGFQVFASPQPLPAFSVTPLAGDAALSEKTLAGSATLLNFWATWCPPCKQEMPSIEKLHEAMKGESFKIVAISVGEAKDTVSAFIADRGFTFPVYLDEKGVAGQIFASQGIPTTYILDADGRAIAGTVGAREYDEPELVAALKELAAR